MTQLMSCPTAGGVTHILSYSITGIASVRLRTRLSCSCRSSRDGIAVRQDLWLYAGSFRGRTVEGRRGDYGRSAALRLGVPGSTAMDLRPELMRFTARNIALCGSVALALSLVTPAHAGAHDFGRHVLVHNPLNNCELGADALPGTGTPSRSQVVTHPARSGLGVLITLRDAAPTATYHVFLIHADGQVTPTSSPDCLQEDGSLTTTVLGRGSLRLKAADVPDHPFVHIYVEASTPDGLDWYDTGLINTGSASAS